MVKTAKTPPPDETRSRAEALVGELVANGDLDNLVHLARLLGSAQDALSDDMVTRLASTAAGGMDLLDRANRSGVAQALPAIGALVENGDLDRLVEMARLVGSAQDALTDDMVTRLASTAAGGMDLLDRANRSGLAHALPAITALVENGDLDRLVGMARLVGSAQDALSDDMVTRLARMASEGMILIDRLTRADGFMNLIRLLEQPEIGETLGTLLGALSQAHETVREAPAKGGLGGAIRLMSDPGTQDALRLMAGIGKALSAR